MSLRRKEQIAAKVETAYGTAVSLAAADAKHLVISPSLDVEPAFYERNHTRGTLTQDEALTGIIPGSAKFGIELAGEAAATPDLPPWDLFMRACGFRSVATRKITIGAVTDAPFRHGETITQAVSAATAKVMHDTYDGTTTLYVSDVTGTPNSSNVWTGGTSGASATPSTADTDAGQTWYPYSTETVTTTYTTLTGTLSVGAIVKGNTSGMKAIVEAHNTSTKTLTLRIYSGTITATETISLVSDPSNHNVTAATAQVQLDIPTLSIGHYQDGTHKILRGCRGTWSMAGKVGEPVIMNFDFKGAYSSQGDLAPLTGVSYASKIPPVLLSAGLKLGSEGDTVLTSDYQPRASSLTLALNNTVELGEDFNLATGINRAIITSRAPAGTLDPEHDLEASYAFMGKFTAGTIARMYLNVGSTNGNKFKISVPGMQYRAMPSGDRNGQTTREVAFNCTGGHWTNADDVSGTDNEIVITYLLS